VSSRPDAGERVGRGIATVRREVLKAAVLHATVYAALAILCVNLVATVSGVESVGRLAVAGLAGVLTFGATVRLRTRTPPVEQFEAVNPPVAEALRTARDALDRGDDSTVARRLYADVLAGLGRASSADLVDGRRLATAVVLLFGVAAATVGAGAAGLDLLPADEAGPTPEGDPAPSDSAYDGLADGEDILGEETDVAGVEDDRDAVVGGTGGGDAAANDTDPDRAFETGGFADSGAFEAQSAAFAGDDDVRNADIIREYNVRIRQDSE
jgi:hypothetical protein